MPDRENPGETDMTREAHDFAQFLSARRSKKLSRLFAFLLQQAQQGHTPDEAEIAAAVRGDGGDALPASNVRVYISRLRKMMDDHYAQRPGPRLSIPRGQYRLVLDTPDADTPPSPLAPLAKRPARPVHMRWVAAGIAALNLALAAAFWLTAARGKPALADTLLWQPMTATRQQTIVVVGDHFLFGERHGGQVDQIVRDLAIASRADLPAHGAGADGPIDLDLAYTSSNLVFPLRSLWTALDGLNRQPTAPVVPASQLDPDMLKSGNIIYVGPLDGLGPLLGDALARASGFALEPGKKQLVDKATHRAYRSDLALDAGAAVPLRDYGYIASLPGPAGNRIVIIAGLGDAGVTQMGDLAASRTGLAELRTQLGRSGRADSGRGFEALFQVKALYSQGFGRQLAVARDLGNHGFWDAGPAPR